MADSELDSLPSPEPESRPRASLRWLWVLLLLALIAVAARWGVLALQEARVRHDAAEERVQLQDERFNTRLDALERSLDQIREAQQRLVQRLDSSNATNQVLREEVLGMGERAGLLEDAVARLSQSRLGGDALLRLNEAEFLLSMGAERLALYADAAASIQAYTLAEGALAGLDDPALATLRQTLAQELIQLRDVPPDPRPGLRAELVALAAQLASLPASREGEVPLATPDSSRMKQMLAQLVTVRRIDTQATLLGPAQRQAALAALTLQFELAQAALARPDESAFRSAIEQIESTSRDLFDQESPTVAHWRERLAALHQATLLPAPPVLGATLRELRSLRAARQVGSSVVRLQPLPPPATPTAPVPPPDESPAQPMPAPETHAPVEHEGPVTAPAQSEDGGDTTPALERDGDAQ